MTDERDDAGRALTIPQAKRSDRERPDPENQPEEYTDDMRVNRFTPPPDPEVDKES
jgi:hypothetical protein